MAASNGAVGDRGFHSGNSRTHRVAKGARKIGQPIVSRKARLIAVVVVVLLVGAFAVVLVQGHTPSAARSSKPYSLDYLLWTADGDQLVSHFGADVSSAGDVNNDGYDDVIIGAPNYGNGQGREGRAYLYLGSSTGLSASPSWTYESDNVDACFGCSVSSAGDVNADSYDDVIIGAFGIVSDSLMVGRAYVFLGSSTGLSVTPSWTAEGDQDRAFFGTTLSSAGDVNNDSYDDVIVGAYYYRIDDYTYVGRAYVFLGSSAGLPATPSWIAEGDQNLAIFGYTVSSAGDVNNDGYDDVVVGAPWYDNPETDEGRAYLYLGTSTGLSATPSWVAEGGQTNSGFGGPVSSAGDVNNDGYDDVVIASGYFNDSLRVGRAYLYLGSSTGLSASPSGYVEGDQDNSGFGASSSAGDVNNDGYDDVIVGAYEYDNGQTNEGRAYLYLGSYTGLSATPSWIAESDCAQAHFGCSVSSAGDVNGDGLDEVIVGAYRGGDPVGNGRAYVYGELLIPEFSTLLIPVVGAVAIVVALRRLHTSVDK